MTEQELIDEGINEGKKSFEYYWKQIVENFDFEKVAKVMAFLNWGWSMGNDMKKGLAIPDKNFLIEDCYEKCREVYETGKSYHSGGFEIDYNQYGLSMKFVLEDWIAD